MVRASHRVSSASASDIEAETCHFVQIPHRSPVATARRQKFCIRHHVTTPISHTRIYLPSLRHRIPGHHVNGEITLAFRCAFGINVILSQSRRYEPSATLLSRRLTAPRWKRDMLMLRAIAGGAALPSTVMSRRRFYVIVTRARESRRARAARAAVALPLDDATYDVEKPYIYADTMAMRHAVTHYDRCLPP